MKTYNSFQDFADEVGRDDKLAGELAADPAGAIQKVKIKNKWVYRMAVIFLGSTVGLIVLGAILSLLPGKDCKEPIPYPEFLIAIASTAVGAIAGLISQNT